MVIPTEGDTTHGAWKFLDDLTNLDIISVNNCNSSYTSRAIIFNNITETSNVIYGIVQRNYSQGNYVVGGKVNFTTGGIVCIDNEGTIISYDSVGRAATLSGTTLNMNTSASYSNWALVIIGEYIP